MPVRQAGEGAEAAPGAALETARLRLRRMIPEDAPFVLRLLNQPSFIRNVGDRGVRTVEDAEGYVRAQLSRRDLGFGMDVLELRDSGTAIGICGLLMRPVLDHPDLGYALLPEHWSRGYVREIAAAVLADAGRRGIRRVYAVVSAGNDASVRVLERLGFQTGGTVRLPGDDADALLFQWSPEPDEPLMSTPSPIREYEVAARTAPVFGRVLCSARNHHFVADGPVQNGCPGEALTPAELFLSAVAACGTELMQVLAQNDGIPFERVEITVRGSVDRENQKRADVTVFNLVQLDIRLWGPDHDQAGVLVAGFQRRCPLYGSVAVASDRVEVSYRVEG